MFKLLLLSIFLLIATSCQFWPNNDTDLSSDVLAMVNGKAIPVETFQQESFFISNYIPNIRNLSSENQNYDNDLLTFLIHEELLVQAALDQDLWVSEVELLSEIERATNAYPGTNVQTWLDEIGLSNDFWREKLRRKLLIYKIVEAEVYSNIVITEEQILEYYDTYQKEFLLPPRRTVQHLQVKSIDVANLVLREIKRGRSFDQLINTYSIALDRYNQGNLGDIDREFLPEIFSSAIFELPANKKYTDLIESPYGYHLFKVEAVIKQQQIPLNSARAQIQQKLKEEQSRIVFEQWFAKLKSQATIIVNNQLLDSVSEGYLLK